MNSAFHVFNYRLRHSPHLTNTYRWEKVREVHAELSAKTEAHLMAMQAEKEAIERLLASTRSSAAVSKRLVEEGSDMDVCFLAEVSSCRHIAVRFVCCVSV